MPATERDDGTHPPADALETRPARYQAGSAMDALAHYLNVGEKQRQALRRQWADAHAAGNPDAGLRYALALTVSVADRASLTEAEGVMRKLLENAALDEEETTLARLALEGVHSRLASLDVRQQLLRQRDELRAALQRAEQQIEQLTRIEQELEPEAETPPDTPPPQGPFDG